MRYDPLFCGHPGIYIGSLIEQCADENRSVRTSGHVRLKKYGVPLFEYMPDASADIRERALEKIRKWWAESAETVVLRTRDVPLSPEDLEIENTYAGGVRGTFAPPR